MLKNIIDMLRETFTWPYVVVWGFVVIFILLAIVNWEYLTK